MDTFVKAPSSVLDFVVDWSGWLGTDTISTSTWSVPAGITKNSDIHDTTTASIWLASGTAGNDYKLTNTIVTVGGRTESRDLFITVRDLSILNPRTFWYLINELSGRLNNSGGILWTTDQIKRYVNGAISYWDASGGYAIAIDQTMTTVLNQQTYNLPAAITDLRQVVAILRRTSTTTDILTPDLSTSYNHVVGPAIQEVWQDITAFRLTQNGSQVKLLLRNPFAITDVIAIVYKTNHAALSADTDTTVVAPEFIYAFGKYLAHTELASNASEQDRKFHVQERESALRDALKLMDVAMRWQNLDPILQKGFSIPSNW